MFPAWLLLCLIYYSTLKVEELRLSETLNLYQTEWLHASEDTINQVICL